MTQSPSQTVSIYEALAEILSKPTESLNLFNNNSTDRTLFSEAPISSTSTSTTTTTSSTTVKYDDTKVDRVNKKDTPVNIQKNISYSQKSLNSPKDTTRNTKSTLNSLSDLLMSFDESTNHLIWSNIFDTNNETNGKRDMTRERARLDLMTRRVGNSDMEMTSSSFYPVYVPKKIVLTTEMTPSTTQRPLTTHRVVYTVLPNNTIEKKILQQHKGREDTMSNDTRKFHNGTEVHDDVSIEITSFNLEQLNKNKSHESATTESIETVFPFCNVFYMHSHVVASACTIFRCVSIEWVIRSICLSLMSL
jgi:hypothetical protein